MKASDGLLVDSGGDASARAASQNNARGRSITSRSLPDRTSFGRQSSMGIEREPHR